MEVQTSPARMPRSSITANNPCRRSSTVTDTEAYLPLDEELQAVMAAANSLSSECGNTKEAYIKEGLLSLREASSLDNLYYELPGLPSSSEDVTGLSNIEQLTKDVHDLGDIADFLKHSKEQQQNHSGDFFKKYMDGMERAINVLQCSVRRVLRSKKVDVTSSTAESRDIPDYILHLKKSKNRYARDYLLMKQSQNFAFALYKKYDVMRKSLH